MSTEKRPPWEYGSEITQYAADKLPFVSIIIPTFNSAQLIAQTLESVLNQNYPLFEVIIIDCSEDRTLEIIKSFHSSKVTIYSVSRLKRYEMLNKGISQAKGEYINFLFPGDYYLKETLKQMMLLALENQKPNLVYCGTLLREGRSEPKLLFRPLTLQLLKQGQQPTSLQSCWFQTQFVKEIGKFRSEYQMRGGFDLLCRFTLKNGSIVSLNRMLTDYDLRTVTRKMVAAHFFETLKALYRYFGLKTVMSWLFFYQKDTGRYFRLWLRSLRIAFSGP